MISRFDLCDVDAQDEVVLVITSSIFFELPRP